MAYVNDASVRDATRLLLDLIASEPDPAVRLTLITRTLRDIRKDLTTARNEAAWEARQDYSTLDLERVTGVNHGAIHEWVKAHQRATGAPTPVSRRRRELSQAHDLRRLPEDRRRALGLD